MISAQIAKFMTNITRKYLQRAFAGARCASRSPWISSAFALGTRGIGAPVRRASSRGTDGCYRNGRAFGINYLCDSYLSDIREAPPSTPQMTRVYVRCPTVSFILPTVKRRKLKFSGKQWCNPTDQRTSDTCRNRDAIRIKQSVPMCVSRQIATWHRPKLEPSKPAMVSLALLHITDFNSATSWRRSVGVWHGCQRCCQFRQ